jgi:hypothetical protein
VPIDPLMRGLRAIRGAIGMTNVASNTPSPRSNLSTETKTIELLTWVLDGPRPASPTVDRASNPEYMVPVNLETPVATWDADSSREAANAGRGNLDKHLEWDKPIRETRIDSCSTGRQPAPLLYLNGKKQANRHLASGW